MPEITISSHTTEASILASALSKSYGRRRAVTDLGFTVRPGEICALLGPNGAGKTSTIRMLVGLSRPDSGTAAILGHPIRLGAQSGCHSRPRE